MAITSYHTINGRIRAESTGGTRTGYLPDALGSVTATVDESGAVVSTYRYKPYGALLAKMGGGTDPRFLWVGQHGYADLSNSVGGYYVRGRHYDAKSASWRSVDVMRFLTEPYSYAGCSPVSYIDPSGWIGAAAWGIGTYNCCSGDSTSHIIWGGISGITGWLIQEVTGKYSSSKDCGETYSVVEDYKFYEAWWIENREVHVVPGQIATPPHDSWITLCCKTMCEDLSTVGKIAFVPGDPKWFRDTFTMGGASPICGRGHSPAQFLMSTDALPADIELSLNFIEVQSLEYSYCCCKDPCLLVSLSCPFGSDPELCKEPMWNKLPRPIDVEHSSWCNQTRGIRCFGGGPDPNPIGSLG